MTNTDRRSQFFAKLADLMEQYGVEIAAAEEQGSYYTDVRGIDFDFSYRPGSEGEDNNYSVEFHSGHHELDASDIRNWANNARSFKY